MNPELAEKQAKRIIRGARRKVLSEAQLAELIACLEQLSQSKRNRLERLFKMIAPDTQLTVRQHTQESQDGQSVGSRSKFGIGRGESKSPGAVRETILRCISFRHLAKNKAALELHNEFSCKGVLLLNLKIVDESRPYVFSLLSEHYPHTISLSSGPQFANKHYFESILEESTYLKVEEVTHLRELLLESEQFLPFLYIPPQCIIDSLAMNWNGVLLAIDCEMVHTSICENDLARLTVIKCDTNASALDKSIFSLVYDSYVIFPDDVQILDYKTQYSGITKDDLCGDNLDHKRYPKSTIRTHLLDHMLPPHLHELLCIENVSFSTDLSALKDTPLPFLVGHGIENDLRALGIVYPLVLDTSVIYQFGSRKPRLQDLAQRYLSKAIQTDAVRGHDSTEDAEAALQLVFLRLELSHVSVSSLFADRLQSAPAVVAAQNYFNLLCQNQFDARKALAASLSQMIYKYQIMKSEAIGQYAYGILPMYSFKMIQHFTLSGEKTPPSLGDLIVWLSKLPSKQRKLCIAIPEPVTLKNLLTYLRELKFYTTPQTLILCIVHAGDTTMCPFVSDSNTEGTPNKPLC